MTTRLGPWLVWGPLVVGTAVLVGVLLWPSRPAPTASWPSYAEVYERVAPVVVSVSLDVPEARAGTGFVVAPRQIVTARHLVVDAARVEVRTADGRRVEAGVVGTDARTDLALLETSGEPLPVAELGSTEHLRVGDTVVAIGNPFGLGHSLSVGVIGSRVRRMTSTRDDRPRVGFLQLAIPLNPGNSGGPIVDERGRVVGVLSGTHAEGQAIAFAVPVETLEETLPLLRRGHQVTQAFLGIRTRQDPGGLMVASVIPGGPADDAGIRAEDRVVAVDGRPAGTQASLFAIVDGLPAEGETIVRVVRGAETLDLVVALTDRAAYPVVVAGMTLQALPGTGGRVVAIRPRSRAERAGVQVGDQVRTVDGLPVQAPADVQDRLTGRSARVGILRDGAQLSLQLDEAG